MIIYRPHRGGLAEAMAEAKEFQTEKDMKKHIYESYKEMYADMFPDPPFEIEDIVIDQTKCSDDKRCGWHDTRYVCVKRFGNEVYDCPQCIGMCATDYERGNNEE